MNRTRSTRLAGPAGAFMVGAVLAVLLPLAGACREGRNALPVAVDAAAARSPAGAGGVAAPATPGAEGPSLGIVLVSKQPRYRLRGGEERIPGLLHLLAIADTLPAKKSAKKSATSAAKKEPVPPDAPAVDMALRIINRSKQRVDFWSDGDPVTLILRLDGVGAETAQMPVMHTMEMRPPKVVTLGPGETFDVGITRLEFGERGDSTRAYWTQPGDYTITPSFETAVRPAWPGTTPDGEGFGRVLLSGPPLKIHVDAP